jgi:hypothetical protein
LGLITETLISSKWGSPKINTPNQHPDSEGKCGDGRSLVCTDGFDGNSPRSEMGVVVGGKFASLSSDKQEQMPTLYGVLTWW